MSLNIIHFLKEHPSSKGQFLRLVLRYVLWQITYRIFDGLFIFKWINDSVLIMRPHEHMVTHTYYTGVDEDVEMKFILRYCDNNDILVDVGGNAGLYTVLASKVKGMQVIVYEPIRETYNRLMANININNIGHKVIARNIGLSDSIGVLRFTNSHDATNHVVCDGTDAGATESVSVNLLDSDLSEHKVRPTIMKIDVEGFELPVLRGAAQLLSSLDLKVIIIELNSSGEKFGYTDSDVISFISSFGFTMCNYDPNINCVKVSDGKITRQNMIFVRSVDEVNSRFLDSREQYYCHPIFRNIS